jgi:hypothetical protein
MLPGRLGSPSLAYQLLAFILTAEALSYVAVKVGGTLAVVALRITGNGTAVPNINYIHQFAPIAAQINMAVHAAFLGAFGLSYLLVSRNWHSVANAGGVLMSETRAWAATGAAALGLAGGAAAVARTTAATAAAREAKTVTRAGALQAKKVAGTATSERSQGGQQNRAALAAFMQRQGHAIKSGGNAELGNQLIRRGRKIASAVRKASPNKDGNPDEQK